MNPPINDMNTILQRISIKLQEEKLKDLTTSTSDMEALANKLEKVNFILTFQYGSIRINETDAWS